MLGVAAAALVLAATALPSAASATGTEMRPHPKADSAFKGIYAFSGSNSSDLATDPDIAGRSLVYYWRQLEPQKGQYNWALVDKDMQPWIAQGKKVVLRVSASGWAKWDKAADSAHGTPQWVYDEGVKSVIEQDKAVFPQYWNPTFLTELADFVKAFAARYDGAANVAFVDIGVGSGGETKPDSEKNPDRLKLWKAIGYTDQVWWTTVQKIIDIYTQSFHQTPTAVMPDATFIGGTSGYKEKMVLDYAVAHKTWLQDNGLVAKRTLSGPWDQTTLVSEQRGSTSETGDKLMDDLQAALNLNAAYILVFTSDLADPRNRDTIHKVASLAHP